MLTVSQLVIDVVQDRATDPAIVTTPTGGGTVTAGTNPPADVDLCGATSPIVRYVDVTPPGGTRKRYSAAAINVTESDAPRVMSFGSVTRGLTDRSGNLRGSTVTTRFADTDRALRELESTDGLVNALVEYYVTTEAAIKAGQVSRRVFSGHVVDAEPSSGLEFITQASDYLQVLTERQDLYPGRVFNVDDFPNLANDPTNPTNPGNPALVGKRLSPIYGYASDETKGIDAKGIVPCHYVGKRLLPVYDSEWDEYVIAPHACASIQSLFVPEGPGLSTGTAYASRFKVVPSDAVVEVLMPGNATWTSVMGSSNPYREFNGRRYAVVYMFGPRSELCRSGQVPLVANVAGIEDVGDSTGDVIESLPLQLAHLLNNWVLQTYATGNWLSYPAVNGYSRIRTDSFEAVDDYLGTRITGGHKGAFLLNWAGDGVTFGQVVELASRHGIRLGVNRHGQIIASAVDPTQTASRSVDQILDSVGAFAAPRRRTEIRNTAESRYARIYVPELPQATPAEGEALPPSLTVDRVEWESEGTPEIDAASVTKYGTRRLSLDLEWTRDAATAADIAAMHVESLGPGPRMVTVTDHLCGTNVDLGDVVNVTAYEGVDANGWTDRPIQVETHTLELDTLAVPYEGLDVGDL